MAEPEYSYREFLNNEIEYDFLTPQDIPASPRYIKFSWQQGYFPENYHYTRIIVQDSIFSVAGRAYYGDKFYQGGASLKIKEEHTLTFDHYNWKHKMGPGITDLSLRNRINLFQKNNSLVLSDSSVRYVLTNHDESRDNDVCQDYSFSGNLTYYREEWAFSGMCDLPYQHEWERWQLGSVSYRIWDAPFQRQQDMLLLGGGLTYSASDSPSLFPLLVLRYNVANRFILRMRLQEVFSEYPLIDYFVGNPLLWRSSITGSQSCYTPQISQRVNIGSELITGSLLHEFDYDYQVSDASFTYFWDFYDEEEYSYIIQPDDRKKIKQIISYSLSVGGTKFDLAHQPGRRIAFEPYLTACLSQQITCNIFNEFLLSLTYKHDEKLPARSSFDTVKLSEERYFITQLRYRYTKLKSLTIESGMSYSNIDLNGSYMKAVPEFYIRIYYGKVDNESSYR